MEGLRLRLKLQHFGPLMRRANSSEKMLMLGERRSGNKRRADFLSPVARTVNDLLAVWSPSPGACRESIMPTSSMVVS